MKPINQVDELGAHNLGTLPLCPTHRHFDLASGVILIGFCYPQVAPVLPGLAIEETQIMSSKPMRRY